MQICNQILSNYKQQNIEIINVAWRPLPDHAAGGPGGVLKIIKDEIGGEYRGYAIRYFFESSKFELPEEINNFLKKNKISNVIKRLVLADYYISNIIECKIKIKNEFKIFVCHDLGSAVGAYHLGYPYYLVYHHQGSYINERESFGQKLNKIEKDLINRYEEIAFNNAKKVYFPSIGAKEEFLKTTTNKIETSNFSNDPLYNSIPNIEYDEDGADKFIIDNKLEKIFKVERDSYLIFCSIGDYSYAKGLDRCLEFFNKIEIKTNKKIFWITFGSKVNDSIYNKIKNNLTRIEKFNYPEKIDHKIVMSILKKIDIFIMLQRCSIFDFSTLEAMFLEKPIILSNIGGNLDFNKKNNIIYFDGINISDKDWLLNLEKYSKLNKEVFNNFFNVTMFNKRYLSIYNNIIKKFIIKKIDIINDFVESTKCKDLFFKKDVLIVGPGSSFSLSLIEEKCSNYTKVALNSALKLPVKFDVHFMQDNPNPENLWDIYNNKDVLRIYGIPTRGANIVHGIEWNKIADKNYLRYMLEQTNFDPRYNIIFKNLKEHCVQDMQSIFFSAIQIIMYFNPKSISIIGIDFSDQNYDGKNISKYSKKVWRNFEEIIKFIKKHNVDFNILQTTSDILLNIVNKYYNVENFNTSNNFSSNKNKKFLFRFKQKFKKLLTSPKKFFSDMFRNLANKIDKIN